MQRQLNTDFRKRKAELENLQSELNMSKKKKNNHDSFFVPVNYV